MATKYEEICTAGKEWTDRIHRAQGYLFALQREFISYCQIPQDRVEYLKWVGPVGTEQRYSRPDEPGRKYFPVAAAVFDEDKGLWRLGMRIPLPAGSSLFFALRVSERDGKAAVEIREGDAPMLANVEDPQECTKIFDTIINEMKEAFGEGKGKGSQIGFELGKADGATA